MRSIILKVIKVCTAALEFSRNFHRAQADHKLDLIQGHFNATHEQVKHLQKRVDAAYDLFEKHRVELLASAEDSKAEAVECNTLIESLKSIK